MAEYIQWQGNILECPAGVITDTVNCVGAWRAGLNKQFGERWPGLVERHRRMCEEGRIKPGVLWLWPIPGDTRRVLMFPTKDNYRMPSTMRIVCSGLEKLASNYEAKGITEVALPPLGCGLGGLRPKEVATYVRHHLGSTNLKVYMVIPPKAGRDLQLHWR